MKPSSRPEVELLLKETITRLCSKQLDFDAKVSLDALIGVTVDDDRVILVSIKETIHKDAFTTALPQKDIADTGIGVHRRGKGQHKARRDTIGKQHNTSLGKGLVSLGNAGASKQTTEGSVSKESQSEKVSVLADVNFHDYAFKTPTDEGECDTEEGMSERTEFQYAEARLIIPDSSDNQTDTGLFYTVHPEQGLTPLISHGFQETGSNVQASSYTFHTVEAGMDASVVKAEEERNSQLTAIPAISCAMDEQTVVMELELHSQEDSTHTSHRKRKQQDLKLGIGEARGERICYESPSTSEHQAECSEPPKLRKRDVRKTGARRRKYAESLLSTAVELVREGKLTTRQACEIYDVPKSTLQDKVTFRSSMSAKIGPPVVMTADEEERLENWILDYESIGQPVTVQDIKAKAKAFLDGSGRQTKFPNNLPGAGWMRGFLERHTNITSSCIAGPRRPGQYRSKKAKAAA